MHIKNIRSVILVFTILGLPNPLPCQWTWNNDWPLILYTGKEYSLWSM